MSHVQSNELCCAALLLWPSAGTRELNEKGTLVSIHTAPNLDKCGLYKPKVLKRKALLPAVLKIIGICSN
jgi:hypothetical protein